jgi:cell wall-associated NlpC family hydrolase
MPYRRHVPRYSPFLQAGRVRDGRPQARRVRGAWRACAVLAGTLVVGATVIPGSAQASPATSPTLSQTLAKANALSAEIDSLSQQYDGLRIQLSQARAEAKLARENAAVDAKLLGADRAYLNQIAVEGYMAGGMNPALQLLQTATPQKMLDRASIMAQLEQQNGEKVNLVAVAETAAQRATAAAAQEQERAVTLQATMAKKVAQIQQKENFFNSKAYAQAAAIYQQTGHYPAIHPKGDTVGVQALRFALTRIGDPYVWAAAGPSEFDCSGLVVWAYGKVGISLEHFTGDLWNEVVHVPYSQAKPGDLVFFYADISHVGIYIGNGLMVDAPTAGQDVQIQPVSEDPLVGVGYVP